MPGRIQMAIFVPTGVPRRRQWPGIKLELHTAVAERAGGTSVFSRFWVRTEVRLRWWGWRARLKNGIIARKSPQPIRITTDKGNKGQDDGLARCRGRTDQL